MDAVLLNWTRDQMVKYNHLGAYIEHLCRTRQNDRLLEFVLEYGKENKEFMMFLTSLRSADENSKLAGIKNFFDKKSKVTGHFTITV